MVKRIEYDNGTIHYKNENGELHREDGPAMIFPDGTNIWYKDSKIHREDGPAMIYPNGDVVWWFNDYHYSFKKWCELINISDELKMELALRYG